MKLAGRTGSVQKKKPKATRHFQLSCHVPNKSFWSLPFALVMLLLTSCAVPHRPPMVWTEVGWQRYDHQPYPRQQRAYNEVARKSMGISRAEWDAAENRLAWEDKHPRFAPRAQVHDRALELALDANP